MKEAYLYKKLKDPEGVASRPYGASKKVQCRKYKFSKRKLKKLYVEKKLSMEKIAKLLGVGTSTVWKYIHSYNIPVRKFKYKKYDFSGDPKEKAYILGLVAGDICAYRHYRQIAAEITTTHPAMMNLFCSVFKKYGTPTQRLKYNKITGRYEKIGHILLNNSFEFLLSKNFQIDNEYFYHFLAGFFDSEGCVHVYNNHGYIGLSILMYNSNKKLLEAIKNRLKSNGFHPKFYKFFEKGQKTTNNYIRGNDLWTIAMHTIGEILTSMRKVPIKHKEKIEKIKIVSSSSSNKWEVIADQVSDLKAKIKKEVKEFIKP